MKIPKKINPDNLKNAIVQVIFNPGIPPALFLGRFEQHLSAIFDFKTSSPLQKAVNEKDLTPSLQFNPLTNGYFLDKVTKQVKVDVFYNSISFNLVEKYAGWENYFSTIKTTINKLFDEKLITAVNRIGVRYISQFDDLNLFNNLNVRLPIEIPNINLDGAQVKSVYKEGSFEIILTLINKINNIQLATKTSKISLIDIDIIQNVIKLDNSNQVLENIEKGHQKQKEIFFSLLKPEFLETLNPVY